MVFNKVVNLFCLSGWYHLNLQPLTKSRLFQDSDDEGEAYEAVTASVAELMGDSDDDIFSWILNLVKCLSSNKIQDSL